MARLGKKGGWVLLAVLVLLLFAALNPNKEDFEAWQAHSVRSSVSSGSQGGVVGVFKSGGGQLLGALAGTRAAFFTRNDYYLFSTFRLGGEKYLGILHLFFKIQ